MTVVQMDGWRADKTAIVANAPALECPQCDSVVPAINVAADGTTSYRCAGHGHRPLAWRIDTDGNMLRGLSGNRYY